MSSEAVNRYDLAMLSLLFGRANGSMTDNDEERLIDVMNKAWKEMTEEEHNAINEKCKEILEKAGCLDII
jgi:hypothetical protein